MLFLVHWLACGSGTESFPERALHRGTRTHYSCYCHHASSRCLQWYDLRWLMLWRLYLMRDIIQAWVSTVAIDLWSQMSLASLLLYFPWGTRDCLQADTHLLLSPWQWETHVLKSTPQLETHGFELPWQLGLMDLNCYRNGGGGVGNSVMATECWGFTFIFSPV